MQSLLSEPIVSALVSRTTALAGEIIDAGGDPQLAVILVGEDPQSLTYVSKKQERAQESGITFSLYHLEGQRSFEDVAETVRYLNADPEVHGVIIQLPLPAHFSQDQVSDLLNMVDPEKDVDGLRNSWVENLPEPTFQAMLGSTSLAIPPMVEGVVSLLDYYGHTPVGKKIVVVGSGRLVGQPLEKYFKGIGCDIELVNEETPDIFSITQTADILITGTGESDLVTYQWIKEGAIVLNASSDVHVDSVSQVAAAMSPAKGGIGPLTVAWLLYNVVVAAARRQL